MSHLIWHVSSVIGRGYPPKCISAAWAHIWSFIIRCCISNHTTKCNLKNEARRMTGKHMQNSGLLFVTAAADPVTMIVCEA